VTSNPTGTHNSLKEQLTQVRRMEREANTGW